MARAQTNYDFMIGATIMLLTVLFVLINMPAVFDLGGASTDGLQRAQADRAAEYLINNYSTEGSLNELSFDEPDGGIDDILKGDTLGNAFRSDAGLNTNTDRRTPPNVNISLFSADELDTPNPSPIEHGGSTMTAGDPYTPSTSAATVSRIVTLTEPGKCTSTCRLVVRVW